MCTVIAGATLPPKTQGQLIGTLSLSLQHCRIAKHLVCPPVSEQQPLHLQPKALSANAVAKDGFGMFGGTIHHAVYLRIQFWGEESSVDLDIPASLLHDTSRHKSVGNEAAMDDKQMCTDSFELSTVEYPLIGSVQALNQYMCDMKSLPLAISGNALIPVEENNTVAMEISWV